MKVRKNEKLRKAARAENYEALAEQWIESVSGEEPAVYQIAFLEDLYPACHVVSIEARLPLPGLAEFVLVHVHMSYSNEVFSLIGKGDTYEAALMSAVLDGTVVFDAKKDLLGTLDRLK